MYKKLIIDFDFFFRTAHYVPLDFLFLLLAPLPTLACDFPLCPYHYGYEVPKQVKADIPWTSITW